jgi:ADP-ribose pyrophosphatase YjhB (NUDIX family)
MITAQVVLINKEGLVLGVSRKTNHNDFGLPGGKMDPEDNENPVTTAIRETFEETGLRVTNFKLVFAIHKSGNMGYTYLADYEGEINHNEPHVVRWLPFERLVAGSFGKYNKLVSESLTDMGIQYTYLTPLEPIIEEVRDYVNSTPYDGYQYEFDSLRKQTNWLDLVELTVYFKGDYEELEECLGLDDKFNKGLKAIGDKHGFRIHLTSDYISK